MRVIAGTFRSRPLLSPRGLDTRPTSDRLRETLFNILQPRIEGARFADLYAGTGAVGIEAISRGAAHVLFAERAEPAVANLRANLQALGIRCGYTLEARSAISALDKLTDKLADKLVSTSDDHQAAPPTPDRSRLLDIVFLDPPYDASADYTNTLALLGSARAQHLLAPDALIIAEHSSRIPLPAAVGRLRHTRTLKQGDAALTFFQPQPAVDVSPS